LIHKYTIYYITNSSDYANTLAELTSEVHQTQTRGIE